MGLRWLTTERCNQHCRYCDRFLESSELSSEDYNKILDKLISYGVKKISFGGGESLMLECFADIVKKSARNGIYLKLITNGKLLPENIHLLDYIAEVTFSLDSADSATNEIFGRGYSHFDAVRRAISAAEEKRNSVKINNNTVVNKLNLEQIEATGAFIKQRNIQQWKLLRFCPLRGSARRNRELFEITDKQFGEIKEIVKDMGLKCDVQFRGYEDMEKRYLLINPQGKLCVTRNMEDVEAGDFLKEDLHEWFNRTDKKF